MTKEEKTTISISKKLAKQLRKFGSMGSTYEEVIEGLLKKRA